VKPKSHLRTDGTETSSGYSGTPLWKKLGYKSGISAYVRDAPAEYLPRLALPGEVRVDWSAALLDDANFIHHFAISRSRLKADLKVYRKKMAVDGVIWISWPKKTSGVATDITEDVVRELALPMDFVDIKVCAIDEVWSGLKLMVRKAKR